MKTSHLLLRAILLVIWLLIVAIAVQAQDQEQDKRTDQPQPATERTVAPHDARLLQAVIEDGKRRMATAQAELAQKRSSQLRYNPTASVYHGRDEQGYPVFIRSFDNANSAISIKANKLYNGGGMGLNLNGSRAGLGYLIGVVDVGRVRTSHAEFGGRVTNVAMPTAPAGDNPHATHVSGTVAANGTVAKLKGLAFGATVKAYFASADHLAQMDTARRIWISNHSYGNAAGFEWVPPVPGNGGYWLWHGPFGANEDWKFGIYEATSAGMDALCNKYPDYLMVKAAGNNRGGSYTGPLNWADGYWVWNPAKVGGAGYERRTAAISRNDGFDNIPTYGVAKNILTVGSVDTRAAGAGLPAMSTYSSFGPTDDGRIKPDIVAAGTDIISTGTANDNAETLMSGTSMASPAVTGTMGLLDQLHYQITQRYMRSAACKAAAIHTAEDGGNPGPDYRWGWGMLDAEAAANLIRNHQQKHLFYMASLQNNKPYYIRVRARGGEALKATIVWNDPAAAATANGTLNSNTRKLVNDLDLRIIDSTGPVVVTQPWVLDPTAGNQNNNATRGDNIRDNVEQVILAAPVADRYYTIRISHKGNLTLPVGAVAQEFAIAVSGIRPTIVFLGQSPNNANSSSYYYNWTYSQYPKAGFDICVPPYFTVNFDRPQDTVMNLTVCPGANVTIASPKLFVQGHLLAKGAAPVLAGGCELNTIGTAQQDVQGIWLFRRIMKTGANKLKVTTTGSLTASSSLKLAGGDLDVTEGYFNLGFALPAPILTNIMPWFRGIGLINLGGTIEKVEPGASITGDKFNINRTYNNVLQFNVWSFMGTVTQNTTLAKYHPFFRFAGIQGGAQGATSVYFYNPSDAALHGWTVPGQGINTPCTPGVGFRTWMGNIGNIALIPSFVETGRPVYGPVNVNLQFCNNNCPTWVGGPVGSNGFNLVANPYQSAIRWNNIGKVGITPMFWAWNKSVYGGWSDVARVGINGIGSVIPAGQGFFVYASGPGSSVSFNENMKVSPDTVLWMLRQGNPDAVLRIGLKDTGRIKDETVTRFMPVGTRTFNASQDLAKWMGGAMNIWQTTGGTDVAIKVRPSLATADTIWMALKSTRSGSHTLTASDLGTFDPQTAFYAQDLTSGQWIDLTLSPEWTVTLNANQLYRFPIVVVPPATVTHLTNKAAQVAVKCYPNPATDQITVTVEGLVSGSIEAELLDLTGKLVTKLDLQTGRPQTINTNHLPRGVYQFKYTANHLTQSHKLVLK